MVQASKEEGTSVFPSLRTIFNIAVFFCKARGVSSILSVVFTTMELLLPEKQTYGVKKDYKFCVYTVLLRPLRRGLQLGLVADAVVPIDFVVSLVKPIVSRG